MFLEYFNLNQRYEAGLSSHVASQEEESLDVQQRLSQPSSPQPVFSYRPMSIPDQVIMYFGVLIGVLFSFVVQQNQISAIPRINITLGTLIIAAVVALAIIPLVFERLSARPDAPFIVRLGFFVQHGVFWQVLTSSISKTITA